MALTTLSLAVRPGTGPWARWLGDVEVSAAVSSGPLAVYPLNSDGQVLPRHLSLDRALAQGDIRIEEISEGGDVNRLRVENRGDLPVFIMGGEVLSGARQDRILQHDLWLPADSGPVTVSVYCVEHGRWSYRGSDRKFDSKATLSNLRVRRAAMSEGGQGAVWQSVDETCKSGDVAAPTRALNAAYEDPKLIRHIDQIERDLRDVPEDYPSMTGVAVQMGNRVVAVDLFGERRQLRALWPKLLRSYALEARLFGGELGSLQRQRVREFLSDLSECDSRLANTPGEGDLYRLRDPYVSGEALVIEGNLAHLQGLREDKGEKPWPRPSPSPSPWPPAIDLVKPNRPR